MIAQLTALLPVWGPWLVGAMAFLSCLMVPVPTSAVLVADGMNWDWAQKNIGMFALVTAAVIRWWLPSIIERGKQIIKDFKVPSLKKPTDGDSP